MSYAGPAAPNRPSPTIRRRLERLTPSTGTPRGKATLAAGIVIGIAIGAGVALLLAPGSGDETRGRIARAGRRVGKRGRDAWDDLRYELRRMRRRRVAQRRADSRDDLSAAP